MAKSKLGEQLEEATALAGQLNDHARAFGQLKGNFAADLALGAGVGGGASSIAEFLQRRESGGGQTISSGGGAGGSGSRSIAPSPADLAAAQTLGESVEYVRQLMKAAAWAGLSAALVLRSPKAERDALIAAYEASGAGGMGSSSGGGSGNTVGPRQVRSDNLGNYNTADANRGNTVVVGPYGGTSMGSSAQSAKAAPDPTPAIASGAQATVAALGKVVGELQRLNERVAKTPTGIDVALRTGAGG